LIAEDSISDPAKILVELHKDGLQGALVPCAEKVNKMFVLVIDNNDV
jgi:hypothetical protein